MRYIYLLIPSYIIIIIVMSASISTLDTRIEYGEEDWLNRYPLDVTDSYQLIDSIEDLSIYSEHIIVGRVSNLTSLLYHSNDPYIKELEKYGNIVIDIEMDITDNYNGKHISFLHRYFPTISIGDKILIFLYKGENNTVWENKYLANGIFKIIDNKIYHHLEYPEGIAIDELIRVIKEYRSIENRFDKIKYDDVLIMSVESIDYQSHGLSNITFSLEEVIVGNEKELNIIDHNYKWNKNYRYLLFMKDGHITSRYQIIDEVAYGREFREGIELDKLIELIKRLNPE